LSLLLLLKPNGVAVIPPPPVVTAPVTGSKRTPPPQVVRFRADTARILIRASAPQVILIPETVPARVRFAPRAPSYELRLAPQATKSAPPIYRAVRDESQDKEFWELVEAAYFLTR
jgi:hypothetical protein